MTALIPILMGLSVVIVLSAMYSGSEAAAIATSEPKLRERSDSGDQSARRALELLADKRRVLAVVLVGNNIVNVSAALLAEQLFTILGSHYSLTPLWIGVVNFLVITPVLLMFGEILPKHFCRLNADVVFPRVASFLKLSAIVSLPILSFCTLIVSLILRAMGLGGDKAAFQGNVSLEDLRAALATGDGEAAIPPEKAGQAMIARIFDLRDTIVREIMRPLVDVVSFRLTETTLDDVRRVARESGYSRFPVFEDRSYRMNGYIDIYDVIRREKPDSSVRDFVRAPVYVPETMSISDLLATFQRERVPAVIAIDEHGGTVGWVTLEDALEEVVGEIEDEFDQRRPKEIEIRDAETMFAASQVDIDDMNRLFDLDLPRDEDFDTLGGLVLTRLGRVPELGDTVREGWVELRVEAMEGVKIKLLRLRVLPEPEGAGAPSGDDSEADRAELKRQRPDFSRFLVPSQAAPPRPALSTAASSAAIKRPASGPKRAATREQPRAQTPKPSRKVDTGIRPALGKTPPSSGTPKPRKDKRP